MLWHELWLGKPQDITSTPELPALPPISLRKSVLWRDPSKWSRRSQMCSIPATSICCRTKRSGCASCFYAAEALRDMPCAQRSLIAASPLGRRGGGGGRQAQRAVTRPLPCMGQGALLLRPGMTTGGIIQPLRARAAGRRWTRSGVRRQGRALCEQTMGVASRSSSRTFGNATRRSLTRKLWIQASTL